jgi:hypothetical protein
METNTILRLIVPEEILKSFDLVEIKESATFTELYLEEKKELIPILLEGEEVILDGFCNPLSLLSFPLKAVPTYLVIKRRRWKKKSGGSHYSNDYYFNHPNIKATKEFAAFLKEVHGHTPDEYLSICRTHGC